MADVSDEITINSPPDVVWAALADFGAISAWAPNVDHSCLTTEQDQGVGSVRRVQVGRNALLERVVEWNEGQSLAYSSIDEGRIGEGISTIARVLGQ